MMATTWTPDPTLSEGAPLNTTNATRICSDAVVLTYILPVIMLPIGVVILIGLSFYQRRNSVLQDCCWSRPALLYPIDFLQNQGQLWAYGSVVAIMATYVLNLFIGSLIIDFDKFKEPEFKKDYGWSRVFLVMLNVLIIVLVYQPLLSCITLRRNRVPNVIGLIYVIPMFLLSCYESLACYILELDNVLGLTTLAYGLVLGLPNVIAHVILIIFYVWSLILSLKEKPCCSKPGEADIVMESEQAEDAILASTDAITYVRALLKRKPKDKATSIRSKVKQIVKYSSITGFRYSPRIVVTVILSSFALCTFHFGFTLEVDIIYQPLHGYLQDLMEASDTAEELAEVSDVIDFLASFGLLDINSTNQLESIRETIRNVDYWVYVTYVILMVSMFTSLAIHIFFIVDIVINYKRNMIRLIRGDFSFQPDVIQNNSPGTAAKQCMTYSGYQVAYIIYGWALLALLLFVTLMVASILIFVPLHRGETNFALRAILKLWPSVVVSLTIYFIQVLMCRFLFMQDHGKTMALTNIRMYNLANFFFFFYNIILGLFSCLKRILFSLVFGTLLISRLDRPLLMRGFERFDSGYMAYLGMLTMELHHCHPILKAFVELLGEQRRKKASEGSVCSEVTTDTDLENTEPENIKRSRHRRLFRSIIFKSITLINNPSIILDRVTKDLKNISANGERDTEGIATRTSYLVNLSQQQKNTDTMNTASEAKSFTSFSEEKTTGLEITSRV